MTLDELLPQKLAEWRFDNDRQSLTVTSPESGLAVATSSTCQVFQSEPASALP